MSRWQEDADNRRRDRPEKEERRRNRRDKIARRWIANEGASAY